MLRGYFLSLFSVPLAFFGSRAAEAIKTTDPLRYFERGDFHELKPHKRGYTIVFKHYSGLDAFSIKEIIKWNFENNPVGYVPLFDVV